MDYPHACRVVIGLGERGAGALWSVICGWEGEGDEGELVD